MNQSNRTIFSCLVLAFLVSSCASRPMVEVPDTQPGDQLKPIYMVGNWCTNRELTGDANREAGHSQLTNVSPRRWNFKEGGQWQVSDTGWLYENHGHWKLEGKNTLSLKGEKGDPKKWEANFKNSGSELHLEDEEGKFLILSGCE